MDTVHHGALPILRRLGERAMRRSGHQMQFVSRSARNLRWAASSTNKRTNDLARRPVDGTDHSDEGGGWWLLRAAVCLSLLVGAI